MDRIIKTRSEYEAVLAEIDDIIRRDPDPGTSDGNRLELLVLLANDYEERNGKNVTVDPIEAIKFRMDQQGLSQRDLIPYIGSRSKVSEVLSGKRPLTLQMIRALHTGFGIPADVLLGDRKSSSLDKSEVEWERYPLKEIVKRGWINATFKDIAYGAESLITDFFAQLDAPTRVPAFCRRSRHIRSAKEMDTYALEAWTIRILIKARNAQVDEAYREGVVTLDYMRKLAHLSAFTEGPQLAVEYLTRNGIRLVIEPHLPRTYLDGAAILANDGSPVIGMTIRYDRLDNFWHTLMHELAHVALHLVNDLPQMYDDLDADDKEDPKEAAAEEMAKEALIPEREWIDHPVRRARSPEAVISLARKLEIHPAIVAGRLRHELNSYRILNKQVGHREVRKQFPDTVWN